MEPELYGVGVGPGAPEFITLEAARVLASVDVVFTPAAETKSRSLAAAIAEGAGTDPSRFVELTFPMTRDADELSASWLAAANPVATALDAGKTAAFVTLGDPGVYSTWTYLRRAVRTVRPGTRIATLPGIMALNAAAARLGLPLTEGDERLALVPLPDPASGLDRLLPLFDTIAIYKIGSRLGELAEWARERRLSDRVHIAVGVGLGREWLGRLSDSPEPSNGYLSLAILKRPPEGGAL